MQYRVIVWREVETKDGAVKRSIGSLDFDNVEEAQAMRRILNGTPFLSVLSVRFRINWKWIEVDSLGIVDTIADMKTILSELERNSEQIDVTSRIA